MPIPTFWTLIAALARSVVFTGCLYGVCTEVKTSDRFREASVSLRGPGVTYTGQGTLERDGRVRLDEGLSEYLLRRRVALRDVRVAPDRANISVAVVLPLLGTRHVVLSRRRDEARLAQHLSRRD